MSDKYLTPEEHHALKSHKKRREHANKPLFMAGVAIVILVAGFFMGIAYQKGKHSTTTTTASANLSTGGGFGGRRFGGQRPTFGSVTAISPSSITISDQTTGNPVTFSINSSTTITDGGQAVTSTDIMTSDTVAIIPTNAGSSTALRILVNPSFGGGQFSPPSSGTSAPTVTN